LELDFLCSLDATGLETLFCVTARFDCLCEIDLVIGGKEFVVGDVTKICGETVADFCW
jgi:hypothetical protein